MKIKNIKLWLIGIFSALALLISPTHIYTDLSQAHCHLDVNNEYSNELELYHTSQPNILREKLETAITNAKDSILIMSYSLSDNKLIDLLNEKAEEGLDVTIIVNNKHMGPINIYGNQKLKVFTRLSGEGHMHHKIWVIDNKDVWIGSTNMSSSAFTSQENLMIKISSPELASFTRHEADVFQYGRKRTYSQPIIINDNGMEIEWCPLPHFDPTSPYSSNGIEKAVNTHGKLRLINLIRSAEKTIRVAVMAFTNPDLSNELVKAHSKGIDVAVHVAGPFGEIERYLQSYGIKVTAGSTNRLMHNKFMFIDSKILVNGSANWSRSAFSRNDESFLILSNISKNQISYMEEYWNHLVSN